MLTVWQSNRLERLADRLADIVREPVGAPLEPETIVVQNSGMKRWLSMRLATRLGVCANVAFSLPAELVWRVFRSVLSDVPLSARVEPAATTWTLMGLLARLGVENDPRFAPVEAYLATAGELGDVRRYELARLLADAFGQYVVFRPDWVRAWEAGRSAAPARGDCRVDEAWQAELWRRLARSEGRARHFARLAEELHARLGGSPPIEPPAEPARPSSPRQLGLFDAPAQSAAARAAARHGQAVDLSSLPRRFALFGIPALPPPTLEIIRHLAHHLDVHLFLLNPSRAYWFDIRTYREQLREAERTRSVDPTLLHRDVGNSLLASLGKQSRDFIASLLAYDDEHVRNEELFETPGPDPVRAVPADTREEVRPLLEVLQHDVLDLRERGGRPPLGLEDTRFPQRAPVSGEDRSLQVHVCHGAMREVEVLHDRLLDLFDRHPDLRPSDVVVMTPDIEQYAPAIEAVFATAPEARRIPYSIADRSLAADSPLVAAFLALLDLPGSRYDANRILDLLELPAVQRRFGLDAEQVERAQRWVRNTNIRWGIDESTPRSLGLPASREHTWRSGLDRLVLGSALAGGGRRLFEGILPYDDVEGADARTVGRLVAFAETVFDVERTLATPRPPGHWSADLAELLERVFLPSDEEELSVQSIRDALRELEGAAAGFDDAVSIDLIRLHLGRELEMPAGQSRFLAGRVTFCALVPMRSIPFEVVCLIGMNDDAFPRSHRPPGFDLIAREPRHGDRSRREDDRYLFLEALLSARRTLHVSYVGRSIRDNSEIPPTVLVSELLDAVRRGFHLAGDEESPELERSDRIVEHVVTQHPLQAFSPRYFSGNPKLFSYAAELCEATEAARAQPVEPAPLVQAPLPPPAEDALEVDVERLASFFQNPARGFVRGRFDIRLREGEGLIEDSEPFRLDGLDAFRLRADLLALLVEGVPTEQARELLRARGHLPHGSIGDATFAEVARAAAPLAARMRALLPDGPPPPVAVAPLAAGPLRLTGALTGVTRRGRVDGRPGQIRPADELTTWIRHLVLCALARRGRLPSGVASETHYVGLDGTLVFRPVADAERHLAELAELYRRGLCEPLPFFPASAAVFVAARDKGEREALAAARSRFEGDRKEPSERNDRWVQLAFRDTDPLGKDFAALARIVIEPLCAAIERREP